MWCLANGYPLLGVMEVRSRAGATQAMRDITEKCRRSKRVFSALKSAWIFARHRTNMGRMDRAVRYALRDGVMFNRVGIEIVLLDLDKGIYLGLDEVGSRVWELLMASHSEAEAVDAIAAEYDVDPSRAEQDVAELIADLERHALVTRTS